MQHLQSAQGIRREHPISRRMGSQARLQAVLPRDVAMQAHHHPARGGRMSKVNIDQVSAEVVALIGTMKSSESSAAHDRKLAQPKLQLIWAALEAKQPVSGCKSKGEWAKYAGVTTRYCQYILKDGSRKGQ